MQCAAAYPLVGKSDQRLRSLCAARVESDPALEPGSGQERGNGLDGCVGNGDQNVRSIIRELVNGGGSCACADESSRPRRSFRISTGNRHNRLAAIAEEPAKRLRDPAGANDSDSDAAVNHGPASIRSLAATRLLDPYAVHLRSIIITANSIGR